MAKHNRRPNTKCKICGKPLYRRPFELAKAKYVCCVGCRSTLYKKHRNYNQNGLAAGRGWNRGMSKANGDELKYGRPRSQDTKDRIAAGVSAARPPQGAMQRCEICSKEFYVYPGQNRRFCSPECNYIGQTRQEKRICQTCGQPFSTNQKRVKRFCSRICALNSRASTDIEMIIELWLQEHGIIYELQKPLCGVTIADFFVKPNIVIYCDGSYWHSLSRNRRKDFLQNRTLRENGYRVIRLPGSEIKKGLRPVELLS